MVSKTKIALIGGGSLLGLGAAGFGIRHLMTRARSPGSPKPLTLGATKVAPTSGVIHAEMGLISAKKVAPARMKKPPPPRMPKSLDPAIKVWGSSPSEENVFWLPNYLESDGCKDFRWGFCFKDWIDMIEARPDVPKWIATGTEIAIRISNVVATDATKVAVWIMDNLCLRFKWPLYGYYFGEGGSRWLAVSRYDADRPLVNATPLHPFPPKTGYKRVWFSRLAPTLTRDDEALIVYWPDEKTPKMAELLQVAPLRRMLRLDHRATGAITVKDLAQDACGRSSWWMARRKKAMEEFA